MDVVEPFCSQDNAGVLSVANNICGCDWGDVREIVVAPVTRAASSRALFVIVPEVLFAVCRSA